MREVCLTSTQYSGLVHLLSSVKQAMASRSQNHADSNLEIETKLETKLDL